MVKELVVVDGAGTLFDPGSMMPVKAFKQAFLKSGLEVAEDLIKLYMGSNKLEHITNILTDINADINMAEEIYMLFKESLLDLAPQTEEIPGVKEAVMSWKEKGMLVAMTTGYSRDIVSAISEKLTWVGDVLDCAVTSDDVSVGRPYPFMIYTAMHELKILSPDYVTKIGDTELDFAEGHNAKCRYNALVLSGSITEERAKSLGSYKNSLADFYK